MRVSLAYWVDRLDPFLIHIRGNFGLRYYGLAYVVGLVFGAWLLVRYSRAGRSLLPAPMVSDFIVTAAIGVYAGGRLGSFLLYDGWRELRADPLAIIKIWDGGMSFHGGLIGVLAAVWWYSRKAKIRLLHLWDLVASAAPVGLFFGRVANFINGELWGKPSEVPWAVIFPRSAPEDRPDLLVPRHPSQLYEAGMEGILLFAYMQWRFWKTDVIRSKPGALSGEFLILYACLRMVGELFREPDASLILGLSRGTFYSCFMILVGAYMRFRASVPLRFEPPHSPKATV